MGEGWRLACLRSLQSKDACERDEAGERGLCEREGLVGRQEADSGVHEGECAGERHEQAGTSHTASAAPRRPDLVIKKFQAGPASAAQQLSIDL